MVNLSQFDPSKLGTNETLSLLAEVERSLAKIREHALQKVPFMLVVGDKEAEAKDAEGGETPDPEEVTVDA